MESIVAADGGIVTNGDFNNNNQPGRETRLKVSTKFRGKQYSEKFKYSLSA